MQIGQLEAAAGALRASMAARGGGTEIEKAADVRTLLRLADIRKHQRRFARSEALLHRALAQQPRSLQLHKELHWVRADGACAQAGDNDGGVAHFDARSAFGRIEASVQETRTFLERAVSMNPGDGKLRQDLCTHLVKQGDYLGQRRCYAPLYALYNMQRPRLSWDARASAVPQAVRAAAAANTAAVSAVSVDAAAVEATSSSGVAGVTAPLTKLRVPISDGLSLARWLNSGRARWLGGPASPGGRAPSGASTLGFRYFRLYAPHNAGSAVVDALLPEVFAARHLPLEWKHTLAPVRNRYREVLNVILIKEPLFLAQSLRKAPYDICFDHANVAGAVHTQRRTFDGLAELWNEWMRAYARSFSPVNTVVVRSRDLLFRRAETLAWLGTWFAPKQAASKQGDRSAASKFVGPDFTSPKPYPAPGGTTMVVGIPLSPVVRVAADQDIESAASVGHERHRTAQRAQKAPDAQRKGTGEASRDIDEANVAFADRRSDSEDHRSRSRSQALRYYADTNNRAKTFCKEELLHFARTLDPELLVWAGYAESREFAMAAAQRAPPCAANEGRASLRDMGT
jgi:hypothetical protein